MKNLFLLCFIVGSVALLLLIQPAEAQSQQPRYWKTIQEFKHQDSINFPPKNAILFVGSSSIRKWNDVQEYFPKHTVINRGFGGSILPDLIRYVDDIIIPYHPKQIVMYCGDNDAVMPGVTSDSIFNRFKRLYRLIRDKLPRTQFTYISIKPSPSREKYFPVMQKANWEISTFLKGQKRADFVDIWHLMLDDYGEPRRELFGSDMLHMNKKGYAIWQKAIKPYLK